MEPWPYADAHPYEYRWYIDAELNGGDKRASAGS